MKTLSVDTTPRAEAVQMAILRHMPLAQRIDMASSMTTFAVENAREGIRRARPHLDEQQVRVLFARVQYNEEVARAIASNPGRAYAESETMPPFFAPAVPVIEAFETLDISYYIGGSMASMAHSIPRTTLDIDLVADLHHQHIRPLVEQLQDDFYIEAQAIQEALTHRSSFNVIHLPSSMKVDVFLLKARAFDREAMRRAQPVAMMGRTESDPRPFRLATPEDMVLAKLEWYRLGNEVSERQWNDVLGVLKVQQGRLDTRYMERWAAVLNIADLLEQAQDDAGDMGYMGDTVS